MKIGIFTFHRARNCGAVLQAYALQEMLTSLGAQVNIIDYRCDNIERSYHLFKKPLSFRTLFSGFLHWPLVYLKNIKFLQFRRSFLIETNEAYHSYDISETKCKYDAFVVGSDQVWNLDLIGDDKTYFLDFCESSQKFSYAASFGGSHIADLEKLNDFNLVSVREAADAVRLNTLLNKDIHVNLDPVFLLDESVWNSIATFQTPKEAFIFTYCLHEDNVYKISEDLSKTKGKKIVCVPHSLRKKSKGKNLRSMGPIEFISYIKNADIVVSDSFHVIAFCLIFNKQFVPVIKQDFPKLNVRVTDLLNAVGLSYLLNGKQVDISDKEYNIVNAKICNLRKQAIDYLKLFFETEKL